LIKRGPKGRHFYSKELRVPQEPRRGDINPIPEYSIIK
jgi:hypothetical protein